MSWSFFIRISAKLSELCQNNNSHPYVVLQFSNHTYSIITPMRGVFVKVYIEIVILDNFLIDYLLLSTVSKLAVPRPKKLFIILSALFGTIYAVIAPLKQFVFLLEPAFKILSSAIMILIVFGFRNWRELIKLYALFWVFSLALGGIVSGIGYIFGNAMSYGGILAVSGPPLWLLLLIGLLSVKIFSHIFHGIRRRTVLLADSLELIIDGTAIPAMIDTGNNLFEPSDGVPVIIVPKSRLYVKVSEVGKSLPFKTAAGEGCAIIVDADSIVLSKDGKQKAVRAYIGVVEKAGDTALVPQVLALDL